MRTAAVSLLSLLLIPALAQDQTPHRLTPRADRHDVSDNHPVTCDEAIKVLKETRRILAAGIGQPISGGISIPSGSRPVTREEVVSEFMHEYQVMRSEMKFTPNPAKVEPDRLKISAKEKPELIKLIKMGFVGRVAPLATGPTDSMTVVSFGDAVGFFVDRMAQLTHMPNPKWSPLLGAGG